MILYLLSCYPSWYQIHLLLVTLSTPLSQQLQWQPMHWITHIHSLLKKAMLDHYFKQYHPKEAYKGKQVRSFTEQSHFTCTYLFDIQSLFHPTLIGCMLLKRMIYSFEAVSNKDKASHYNTVHGYMWRTIK